MQILVSFHFNHEESPVAVTGIEGDVIDILLPSVGDRVSHNDSAGTPFSGKVTERIFKYELPNGLQIAGRISVTLCLDRTAIQ